MLLEKANNYALDFYYNVNYNVNNIGKEKKLQAGPIVWFSIVVIGVFAFFCVAMGYSFRFTVRPFRLGCYR